VGVLGVVLVRVLVLRRVLLPGGGAAGAAAGPAAARGLGVLVAGLLGLLLVAGVLIVLVLRGDGGAGLRGRRLEEEGGEVHLDLLAAARPVLVDLGLGGGGRLGRGAGRGGEGLQIVQDRVRGGPLRLLLLLVGLGLRRGLRLLRRLGRRRLEGRRSRRRPGPAATARRRGGRGLEGLLGLGGDDGARRGVLRRRGGLRGHGGGAGRGSRAAASPRRGCSVVRRVVLGILGAVSHAAVSFWRASAPWPRLVIVPGDGSLWPSPSRSSTRERCDADRGEHCGRGESAWPVLDVTTPGGSPARYGAGECLGQYGTACICRRGRGTMVPGAVRAAALVFMTACRPLGRIHGSPRP